MTDELLAGGRFAASIRHGDTVTVTVTRRIGPSAGPTTQDDQ